MMDKSVKSVQYSYEILDWKQKIEVINTELAELRGTSIKGLISQSGSRFRLAGRAQQDNFHIALGDNLCSCGLGVSESKSEPETLGSPFHLFRTDGHIDHTIGQRTSLFLIAFELGVYPHLPALLLWNCSKCGVVGQARNGVFEELKPATHECQRGNVV